MQQVGLHSIELQLTREEWRIIRRLAALRDTTASELVREALRLGPLEPDKPSTRTSVK
jgi:hypothetical protein